MAAVLQGVKSKGDEARSIVGSPGAEDTALLAQLIVV
jgi:hypothetical protein